MGPFHSIQVVINRSIAMGTTLYIQYRNCNLRVNNEVAHDEVKAVALMLKNLFKIRLK